MESAGKCCVSVSCSSPAPTVVWDESGYNPHSWRHVQLQGLSDYLTLFVLFASCSFDNIKLEFRSIMTCRVTQIRSRMHGGTIQIPFHGQLRPQFFKGTATFGVEHQAQDRGSHLKAGSMGGLPSTHRDWSS